MSLGHSQRPHHHTASQLLTPQRHRGTEEHTEIEGSVPSSTTLLSSFDRLSCACPVRQYIDCLSFESSGWHQVFCIFTADLQDLQIVSVPAGFNKCGSFPRNGQSVMVAGSRDMLHAGEWRLHPDVVQLIWQRFGKAEVDLFTSELTTHCHGWFARSEKIQPTGTGCISLEWPCCLLYAFPPFPLLKHRVL